MPESKPSTDQLLVALHGNTAFIRVEQRGSFKISSAMKTFGVTAIERGATRLVFDMSDCIGMDSTFMGVIAGLAFLLKEHSREKIMMVNLSPRTEGLLTTLGLDQLVQTYRVNSIPEDIASVLATHNGFNKVDNKDSTRRETAEMMLEAHRNLIELSPENLPRFKDVLTFLQEDMEKEMERGGE